MKTFVAQLLFRVEDGAFQIDRYEEQWRLVRASDERGALAEARGFATEETATITDPTNRILRRTFVSVKELREIALDNGALLFSDFREIEPLAVPYWTDVPSPSKGSFIS